MDPFSNCPRNTSLGIFMVVLEMVFCGERSGKTAYNIFLLERKRYNTHEHSKALKSPATKKPFNLAHILISLIHSLRNMNLGSVSLSFNSVPWNSSKNKNSSYYLLNTLPGIKYLRSLSPLLNIMYR